MIVNESIWAVQHKETCYKKFIINENMVSKGTEDVVVLHLIKHLSAVSIAHKVRTFCLVC